MERRIVEIMDTTLRDGEQMRMISYSPEEKLKIVKMLLEELNVDRIEIASARVSKGEKEAAQRIVELSKEKDCLSRIEILGFVDITRSVDWIKDIGGTVLNLLCKGSPRHLKFHLRKSLEEHLTDIKQTLEYAAQNNIEVNIYLEDWSHGMQTPAELIYPLITDLLKTKEQYPFKRFMLPDTLGLLSPNTVYRYISDLKERFPKIHLDFHPHNDYGLATANVLSAIEAKVDGIHVTLNGYGERAGNAPMDEVVSCIKDFTQTDCSINESKLIAVSRRMEIYAGLKLSFNKPISGENVFIQTAGVHADGDKKGDVYTNPLMREGRFTVKRSYTLGKMSGKASLEQNLSLLGIELSEDQKARVLDRIKTLGDEKEIITTEDLPYIISDVLDTPKDRPLQIRSCVVVSSKQLTSMATILIDYKGQELKQNASGDGGYDAFMKALSQAIKPFDIPLPKLVDYWVTIPPGGNTDALVQTNISWLYEGITFTTRGVQTDQVMAAVEATEKMLNIIIEKQNINGKRNTQLQTE